MVAENWAAKNTIWQKACYYLLRYYLKNIAISSSYMEY